MPKATQNMGFTLIELSIVLVIIALIVGSVLVGRDLIKASEVRAQVTQLEKYNSAVNTFRGKYGGIPGDLNATSAANFGFGVGIAGGYQTCTGAGIGLRDGNGLIDGTPGYDLGLLTQGAGETEFFWNDLTKAGFLDASSTGGYGGVYCLLAGITPVSNGYVGTYFPNAKIGQGNFVYVYETGGSNWFGVSAITSLNNSGIISAGTTIPVSQTYSIDKKIDDGVPTTGNVQAVFLNSSDTATSTVNTQSSDSATSCYNSSTNVYSINYNGGTGANCALSFRFQ